MIVRRAAAILFTIAFAGLFAVGIFPQARAEGEITLAIAKSVDKTDVAPGEVFTYTLDYAISGTGEVTGADIVDALPEGIEYVSSIKTLHVTTVDVSTADGRDTVTFHFTTPCATGVSGKLRISARFKNGTTADGATAVNNAAFRADGMADVVSNDVTVTAHTVAPSWSVSKAQTVPSGQAVGGYPVTYRVRVTGNAAGSLNLTDVRITDTLPAAAAFVSATGGGEYDGDSHSVSWTIPSINVGGSADRYVTVTYPEDQTEDAVNTAAVIARLYGSDEDQPEKTAQCTTTFGEADPGMSNIVKTNRQPQEEYHPGQTARYGLGGAANTGNVPLDNFMIEDAMPAEIDLTSVTTGNFNGDLPLSVYYTTDTAEPYSWVLWATTTTTANQSLPVSGLGLPAGTHIARIRWRMGTVPAGFAQTGTILVHGLIREDAAGVVTNHAWLTSDYRGEAMPSSHSSVTFDIVGAFPWLAPAKALQGGASRDFGENVSWTLTVKNHDYATGLLTDPVAIDVLPPELTYVSFTSSAPAGVSVGAPSFTAKTIGGKECTVVLWQITGNLDPGEAVTITLTTTIADQTPVGWVTNKFYITTNDPGTASMKGTLVNDADDLDGDTLTDDKLSPAQAQVFVKFQGALTTTTWVKGELDAGWKQYSPGDYGKTLPGGLANFRFTIQNNGSNGPISNIVAINTLPAAGDRLIIGGAARGTAWQPYLVNSITGPGGAALPGELEIYYTTNPNPSCAELYDPVDGETAGDGWSLTPPADITAVTALKFVFNGYALEPGDELSFEWPMRAPLGAPAGLLAWDSMAVGATCEGEDGPEAFLPTESSKVGFIINDHIPYFGIGDHVWVDTNGNGLQDGGEPGVNDVLVNLYHAASPGTVINFTRTGDSQGGSAGYWSFPALIADGSHEYTVEYVFPDSYRATLYNADGEAGAGDTDTDSDIDSTTHGGGVRKGRLTFTSPGEASDRMDYDLGIYLPASLSGLVWNDLDHDGSRDADEAMLAGVTVSLTDAGGGPVTDADGTAVGDATTAADGTYGFTNLRPGSYKVTVTNPEGLNFVFTATDAVGDTADSDVNPAGEVTVNLVSGEDKTHVDAGLHKAALGDRVWHDTDADGIQDAGETGLAGVTVTLKSGGSTVATASTNASGAYLFQDLDAGGYTLELTVPGGYYVTSLDNGANDAADNDFDPATAATAAIELAVGEWDSTADGGLFRPAAVGNLVWNDRNLDGLQSGEPGISGVTVTLTDQAGNPVNDVTGAAVAAAITNGSGGYGFTNLRPGNYRITVTNPDPGNYVFTTAKAGGNDAADSDVSAATGIVNFTLASNASNQNVDAGLHKGRLRGRAWHDLDADGVQDGGEAGLTGVTVKLHGAAEAVAATDASGNYAFPDLDAGAYTVEIVSGSYYTTYPDRTADTQDSDTGEATETTGQIDLAAGQDKANVDGGLFLPASVGNFVWNDRDRDGVQDAGEPGLDGVTVTLLTAAGDTVVDVNGNPIDPVTTSGGTGQYSFVGIRPGTYKLHFALIPEFIFTSALQGGNTAADSNASPATGDTANFTVASNASNTSLDAGLYKASLGDFVWEDRDADGTQDAGEPGMAGVEVRLFLDDGDGAYDADDSLSGTTMTDGTGRYSLSELDHGTYFILVTVPESWFATLPRAGAAGTDSDIDASGCTGAIDLFEGQADTSHDAGLFRAASAGDRAWEDMDADGVQEAGEPGLPGVTVRIRDSLGNPVSDANGNELDAVTTDKDGAYRFSGLRPGSYKLQFEKPEGYVYAPAGGPTATGSDATMPDGWTSAFTLVSNQSVSDVDGGFFRTASISGRVWKEADNDGTQDADETGIKGRTVELRNGLGAVVDTATTAESGEYAFEGLVPGSYHVTVPEPDSRLFFTGTNAGDDDEKDSDVDSDGTGPSVTLVSGQAEQHMDAGVMDVADVAVTKTSDKASYRLGETIVFTITVENLGPDGASGVEITDVLPAGIEYVSDDSDGAYDDETGVWSVGGITSGDAAVLHVTATAEATGSFDNTASLSRITELDAAPGNNDDMAHFSVDAAADLAVEKTVDEPSPWLNDEVVFTITVSNNGPDSATDATVTDVLPDSLEYVSDDSGGDYDEDTGVWRIGSLANGASATLSITAKAVALGTILNTATASADEYDRYPDNNASSCAVAPAARADLSVTKTADTEEYAAGEAIAFTLTVENLGPDDATQVQAVDAVPAGTVFVSASGDGSYDPLTGVWTVGSLADGGTATLVITVTAGDTGSVENAVTVSGFEPDPDPSNNGASVTVQPGASAAGDRVWLDMDGDGLQDEGEEGIAGVTVELFDDEGTKAATTTTDKDGLYAFKDIPSGLYQLNAVPPEGHILSPAGAGADDAVDSDGDETGAAAERLLKAGRTDDNVDFGMFLPNSIVCRVWLDNNRDGVYDEVETPLSGVTVELFRNGKFWGKTVTDSSGLYSFTGLPAGDYTLKFTPPQGLDFTDNGAINIENGTSGVLTLGAGEVATVDSGYAALEAPLTGTADHSVLLAGAATLGVGLAMLWLGKRNARRKTVKRRIKAV